MCKMDELGAFGEFDTTAMILNQAEDALQQGQYDVALGYFFNVLRDADESVTALCHTRIAQCHYRKGNLKQCMESARSSLEHPDSKILMCLVLYKLEDPNSALLFQEEDRTNSSESLELELNTELPNIKQAAKESTPVFPRFVTEKANQYKVQGNSKFKTGDYQGAAALYNKGISEVEWWRRLVRGVERYQEDEEVMGQCDKFQGVLLSNLINAKIKLDLIEDCLAHSKQLIKLSPDWKKTYYWSGTSHLANLKYEQARQNFTTCLTCQNADIVEVNKRLKFVDFCQRNEDALRPKRFTRRLDMFTTVHKSISWLSGDAFASCITKIYFDTPSDWNMTTSALIDKAGVITDFMAPKYETSEKDRNLINEMRRKEKTKIFIHLQQSKQSDTQKIGFSDTDKLSPDQIELLDVLRSELNILKHFNPFVKNFLK